MDVGETGCYSNTSTFDPNVLHNCVIRGLQALSNYDVQNIQICVRVKDGKFNDIKKKLMNFNEKN